MRTTIAATFILAALAVGTASAKDGISVYVTSVGASDGMTDPNKENQDTVKDLRDSLKGKKNVVPIDKRDEATIVLVVQSREKAQITASPMGAILGSGPSRDCTVRVKFIYKTTESELSGSAAGGTMSSGGAWSKAAGKVAKQVEQWIEANKDQVGSR